MLPGAYPSGAVYAAAPGYGRPSGQGLEVPVVKLRGLPFRCEEADVYDFFSGLDVVDILFVRKEQRMNGEAFVLFSSPAYVDMALQRNKMYMGKRYVEVFRAKREEWYNAIANEVAEEGGTYKDDSRAVTGAYRDLHGTYGTVYGPTASLADYPQGGGARSGSQGVEKAEQTRRPGPKNSSLLKLRGLPFSAVVADIIDFFPGFQLTEDAIHIVRNATGRPSGEAFVEFSSPEEARQAMSRDRALIGSRYIELYPSTQDEATAVTTRASQSR